ncbi:hypothetical protein NUW58_g10391 [Xylaria curta]|uniref:Uncharacterized protein n=1 Tax=Xylaria curta TaxID=42375 RepID=A0ACC1ML84_9PEZI|nr:hypothetical protein NUW58_g10391 [Xylaria curta]
MVDADDHANADSAEPENITVDDLEAQLVEELGSREDINDAQPESTPVEENQVDGEAAHQQTVTPTPAPTTRQRPNPTTTNVNDEEPRLTPKRGRAELIDDDFTSPTAENSPSVTSASEPDEPQLRERTLNKPSRPTVVMMRSPPEDSHQPVVGDEAEDEAAGGLRVVEHS